MPIKHQAKSITFSLIKSSLAKPFTWLLSSKFLLPNPIRYILKQLSLLLYIAYPILPENESFNRYYSFLCLSDITHFYWEIKKYPLPDTFKRYAGLNYIFSGEETPIMSKTSRKIFCDSLTRPTLEALISPRSITRQLV